MPITVGFMVDVDIVRTVYKPTNITVGATLYEGCQVRTIVIPCQPWHIRDVELVN